MAPYIFAGVQILHRRLFDGARTGVFSLNRLWTAPTLPAGSRAIVHDGEWYHVGTPEGLAETRARLAEHAHRKLGAGWPARECLHHRFGSAVSRDVGGGAGRAGRR